MPRKLELHRPLVVSSAVDRSPHASVWVVDDDEFVRRGLSRLLRSAGFAVETFDSALACLDHPQHNGPLCMVLDVRMPDLDGLHVQQALAGREAQIVFLTGYGDVPTCALAMKSGAVDFLTKPVDDEILLDAVGRALARSAEIREKKSARANARAKVDKLTPREFEVLQRVITGLLNKQIAAEIGAAEKTVKVHRGRVMEKLEADSVAELIRTAQMAGVALPAGHA